MLEELLIPDLREAVQERDWASLAEFCSILHPSLIAQSLTEFDTSDDLWSAFARIDPQVRTQIFEFLPQEVQDELVGRLPRAELASLLEMMSHDDRVDLIKRMDNSRQAVIMPLVARADREDILRLARYEEGTAGSIMTTDYAALHADLTVEEALARLRQEAPDRETIYYIYVVDGERRLVGFVSLKDLILALPGKAARTVMREDVLFATAEEDVEDVAAVLAQYDLLALPVVDSERKLVGIVTHDDILDVLRDEATEDAHLMGAVVPLQESYLLAGFWRTVQKRVVWLGLLFGAEMFTMVVLDHYELLLRSFTYLVIFIPVITATGGNSGNQAASMLTRALALGDVTESDWRRVALRELFSGLVLGAAVGFLGLIAILLFHQEADRVPFIFVLLSALVLVTTVGSLIGSMLPLFFKRLGWDPAISSGPFVASIVDVLGIAVYLGIATLALVTFGQGVVR